MRLPFLIWHLKSSCRGRKRNPPVCVKITADRIYCPAQTSQPAWWLCLPLLRKGWMFSHYTPLPLFLQIPVVDFPMEKTFLVFSQLEGHKAQAPLLVPGAEFPAAGRVSLTGQHRQCSCCRDATGSGKRGKVPQRTALASRSQSSVGRVAKAVQSCVLCHLTFLGSKGEEMRPPNKLFICCSHWGEPKPKYRPLHQTAQHQLSQGLQLPWHLPAESHCFGSAVKGWVVGFKLFPVI